MVGPARRDAEVSACVRQFQAFFEVFAVDFEVQGFGWVVPICTALAEGRRTLVSGLEVFKLFLAWVYAFWSGASEARIPSGFVSRIRSWV